MRAAIVALSALIASPAWSAGPPFAEFPAGPFARGLSVPPDLSTPAAKAYRTRLREAVRGPVNFAGHYNLATWGCGTSCAMGAVVDRLNGHVTLPPSVCCTEHSSDSFDPIVWRSDSRLIVMSGKINEAGPDVIHYFVLERAEVREARSEPFAGSVLPASAGVPACKGIVSAMARLDCYDRANGR